MRLRRRAIVSLVAVLLHVGGVQGQPADLMPIASFESAERLATDAFGNIYVLDRGAGVLVRLAPDGSIQRVGGSGSPVRDPAAFDPTNGMSILIADGSSGEIHRFNRSLVWTGEVDVAVSGSRRRDQMREDLASGRAQRFRDISAIASTSSRTLFVLDRMAGQVHVFDHRHEPLRSGNDHLLDQLNVRDAADLCAWQRDQVALLDIGGPSIIFLDGFGAVLSERPLPVTPVRGTMTCVESEIRVAADDAFVSIDESEIRILPIPVGMDGPVVAGMTAHGSEYFLTRRTLYRRPQMRD